MENRSSTESVLALHIRVLERLRKWRSFWHKGLQHNLYFKCSRRIICSKCYDGMVERRTVQGRNYWTVRGAHWPGYFSLMVQENVEP